MDGTWRDSTGAFILPSLDFISAHKASSFLLYENDQALAGNLYSELCCVPKHEKALQTPTLRAREASRPGRQRTRPEVEEEGWKDGWRKKLHREAHLITASDVNINRSEDEAARRCERRYPSSPWPEKNSRAKRRVKRSLRGQRVPETLWPTLSQPATKLTDTGDPTPNTLATNEHFKFHKIASPRQQYVTAGAQSVSDDESLHVDITAGTRKMWTSRKQRLAWDGTSTKGMCWWEANVCRVRQKDPASCRTAPLAQPVCGHSDTHDDQIWGHSVVAKFCPLCL